MAICFLQTFSEIEEEIVAKNKDIVTFLTVADVCFFFAVADTGLFKKGDVMEDSGFNKDYFTQIDIRNINEIVLGTKKAKVLTTHPEDSYTVVEGGDGMLTLKILDSTKFWSVTRYLVVRAG